MDKMEPPLHAWQKIAWSDEYIQSMYRDWALYYKFKQQLDKASQYYDKSLELRPEDGKALYQRSICKRLLAKAKSALVDSKKAASFSIFNSELDLEICDATFELNQLEHYTVCLYKNQPKYMGTKLAPFENRLDAVISHFNDSLGKNLGPFLVKNERIFPTVLLKYKRKSYNDPRPKWKVLREENKCDVMSLLEEEEELLSPRELARRERCKKRMTQIYLNRTWKDVCFLKELTENPNLLLDQSKISTPMLKDIVNDKYKVVQRYLKMLQTRSPMYNEEMVRCPVRKVTEIYQQAYLYKVQHQTRRNMITILRTIRQLRSEGKIGKLIRYTEDCMGDYVVLKTYRVMPWKFEFVNEVYDTLALAYTDRCTIPRTLRNSTGGRRILDILRLPREKGKGPLLFVFGDRSTHQEPDVQDPTMLAYKKILSRLEKRLKYTRYGIERCYLFHEIARNHLMQGRFEECFAVARKGAEEAKHSSCIIWQFLCTLLLVKACAIQGKLERCHTELVLAKEISERLQSSQLVGFIDACLTITMEELVSRTIRQSSRESLRKRKSVMSLSYKMSQAAAGSSISSFRSGSSQKLSPPPNIKQHRPTKATKLTKRQSTKE